MMVLYGWSVLMLLSASCETLESGVPVYPGQTWLQQSPASVNLDVDQLDAFRDYVRGRGCIIRHGYLAYTWGDVAKRGDVASAAKPIYAHFLLKALETGMIPSLDEKVSRYEPGLATLNSGLGGKDRNITWRHLANQTSCYGMTDLPGSAYDYNDWQMALFWDLLFLNVYGATYRDVDSKVLQPLLTDPIECQDNPTLMAFGTEDRAGRVGISPRDFARFGLLYLRHGKWRDQQLLKDEYATMAVTNSLPGVFPRTQAQPAEMLPGQRTMGSQRIPDDQTDHMGSYSFLWWTNGVDRHGQRHWPEVPVDVYGAFGHGGPRAMIVLPSLDLVVSWNDTQVKSREMENEALSRLIQAVVD